MELISLSPPRSQLPVQGQRLRHLNHTKMEIVKSGTIEPQDFQIWENRLNGSEKNQEEKWQ
ncbi:hypothetical protein FH972_000063 [Carpinus fangiana]|uniref:Uncharacterized protein n=1 Tax=Carpinus fangiana TaxID=176857 RepID=A0A5N6QAM0_9ROSI|nr:hypothetical protein FH972_000063 [Carpinus fangiana]